METETRTLLLDTAERMLADHCDKALLDRAEQGEFPAALLELIRDAGFHQLALPSSGVALSDGLAVLRPAGRHALPLPLAELLLGNRWVGDDARLISVGRGGAEEAQHVPWGRAVEAVVALADSGEAYLLEDLSVEPGVNLAGEPRDRVRAGRSSPLEIADHALELLALSRVVLMAGGLERALELSLSYVTEREQFGRPLARFQAIQHYMAVMAAEVAAALRASDAALAAVETDRAGLEIAAAKSRVGEAVGIVVELAQQVHGAMGYTHEHRLHHSTRRLWAWRDEWGTEHYWQRRLGSHVAELGADRVWSFLATRG